MNNEIDFVRNMAMSFDKVKKLSYKPFEMEYCRGIFHEKASENENVNYEIIGNNVPFEVIADNLIGGVYDWFVITGQVNGSLVRANCDVINTTALSLLKELGQVRKKDDYDTAAKQLTDYVFQEVYLNDKYRSKVLSSAQKIRGEWFAPTKAQILFYRVSKVFADVVNSEIFRTIAFWTVALSVGGCGVIATNQIYFKLIPSVATLCFNAIPIALPVAITQYKPLLLVFYYDPFNTALLISCAVTLVNFVVAPMFPAVRQVTNPIINFVKSARLKLETFLYIVPVAAAGVTGNIINRGQDRVSNSVKMISDSQIDIIQKIQGKRAEKIWAEVTKKALENGLG